MRKSIFKTRANGDKVKALIEVTNESIRIKVERTPKGCRSAMYCDCDEVAKMMPALSKFMSLDGTQPGNFISKTSCANALHHLINGKPDCCQRKLNASDEDMRELVSLATYGLHKSKRYWSFYSCDDDAENLFERKCKELRLPEKFEELYNEFMVFVENIKEPTYVLKCPTDYSGTFKLYAGKVLRKTSRWESEINKFCRENGIVISKRVAC